MNGVVLTSVEEVTPDWLTEVLRRQSTLADVRVSEVSVEVAEPTFLSFIVKFRVTYAGAAPTGAPARLLLKMTNEKMLSNGGWVPGRNEVMFYRIALPAIADRLAPHCHDAAYDHTTKRFHLLLEDLSDSHYEVVDGPLLPPTGAECELIVEALARLHASMWGDPRLGNGIGPSFRNFDDVAARRTDNLARFADRLGDRLSPERRRRCERMIAARGLLTERFASRKDLTLIHGDAYAGNIFLPRPGIATCVRLIDWENCRAAPAPGTSPT